MKATESAGSVLAPVSGPSAGPDRRPSTERSVETIAAADVRGLLERGDQGRARDLFGEIVSRQQRRASRIAYHYLRDTADADEAVQDAFVKAFAHIDTFKPELSFEAWFTRILTNGCLDRRKAQSRRNRWLLPLGDLWSGEGRTFARTASPCATPEQVLFARERRRTIADAIAQLPDRQRTVFLLSQVGGQSAREVATAIGLRESTVRVHLFRAVRRLRKALRELL